MESSQAMRRFGLLIFVRFLIGIILALLFSSTCISQGQTKCIAFTLKAALSAGQSFEKELGGGLTLKVRAEDSLDEAHGWNFSIEDLSGHDYIAPVNLPLRFNPSQKLGPGYGLSAKESLGMNREVRFILKNTDYQLIDPLWEGALWPYGPNPENATGNYIGAISRITTGVLRVKTLVSDISAEDKIRSVVLELKLTVPRNFPVNPTFEKKSVGCPARFKW